MSTATATIAKTILQQLGGNKFIVMTGAKTLVDHGNGLSFKLPSNFATGGINYVKITLEPSDEYTVEFGKLRGLKYTVIETVEGVYCDMLQDVFTSATGLDTHL